jgi:hypothetical protein
MDWGLGQVINKAWGKLEKFSRRIEQGLGEVVSRFFLQ